MLSNTISSVVACCLLLLTLLSSVKGQFRRGPPTGGCRDTHEMCPTWALQGECYHNRGFMTVYCAQSCDQCNVQDLRCRDLDLQCAAWADKGECSTNEKFMNKTCAKSCGKCLPAADHSVPHIHSNIVEDFWKGNELRLVRRQ